MNATMDGTIYKLCSKAALAEAEAKGSFEGSADDRPRRLYPFLLRRSAGRHARQAFRGQKDLVLLAVDTARLGERLQWEPSRGGAIFPHLYAPLDLNAVLWVEPLPLDADGRPRLPRRVAP